VKLSYPGALVGYRDLGVSVGTDHLQNIVDLIYSARLQGVERLELGIDDVYAWNLVLEHYYLIEHLPEANVCLDAAAGVTVLHVRFEDARNTTAWSATPEEQLVAMSDEDIDRMFADIERPDVVGKITHSLPQNRFCTVRLPEWILAKYRLRRS
jgi:hypothetical protein